MTDLVQWNNCAGFMHKRSLLSEQSTYVAMVTYSSCSGWIHTVQLAALSKGTKYFLLWNYKNLNALRSSERDCSPVNTGSVILKRIGVQHHHQQSKCHWLSVNYRLKPSHAYLRRYEKLVNGRKASGYVMVSVLSPNKLASPWGRRINSEPSSSLFLFPLLEFSGCCLGAPYILHSEEPAVRCTVHTAQRGACR